MKQVKTINLKNMKESIVKFSKDQKEFDEIWYAFYQMARIGFIEHETWEKFCEQCAGWYIDEENACVRDERNCHNGVDDIVWEYTVWRTTSSK